jgi:dTDP-glucose pyrophosphorylase
MINWRACVLNSESKVRDAIQSLNESSARIVLIVDSRFKFIGIVVDGDIRRGILNGVELEDSLTKIVNRKPITVSPDSSRADALAMMETFQVSHIPIVDHSSQLHGLHLYNETPKKELRENLFLIMAGGFGRRMGSLTSKTPKPMLEIAGKPILEHLIVRAKMSGFVNFAIAIHYLGDVIENYFGDGSKFGVNIRYLRETEPLGTAGAIRLIDPIPVSPFLVSNADLISNVDFAALLEFHDLRSCDATMAVRAHQWQNPFGVVEIVEGRVKEIVEKPVFNSNISAGIFVFSPTIIGSIKTDEFCDMPTLFQRLIAENKNVFAFPLYEEWADIGRKAELDSVRLHKNQLMPKSDDN